MFDDILDVSKNNSETVPFSLAPVDIKRLLRETERIFVSASEKSKIALDIHLAPNTPVIYSDYKALRQILIRLLSHMYSLAENGSILLAVHWTNNNLVFEISIHSQRVMPQQNSALSLFKRFCEQLNGTLNAIQTEDRFSIEFILNQPKTCDEDVTEVLPQISGQKIRPTKNVALLVDDTEVNLKVLALMLKKLNIESVCCTSARAALEEIERYTPLAVFIDLWMPVINGEEMAAALQQNPETASIPRILVTADTLLKKNFDGIFHCVMNKPLTLDDIQKVWNTVERLNEDKNAV